MQELPEKIILWDTEYTTWEGAQERKWSLPHEFREIVQIGAVAWDTTTCVEMSTFSVLIHPIRNPVLSEYFSTLTDITQEDIHDHGVSFEQAALDFQTWVRDTPCYAYGNDKHVLDLNYTLHNMTNPYQPTQFFDVRALFEEVHIDTKRFMSSTICEAFGIKNPYRGHDALSDARTIGIALAALLQKTPVQESALHTDVSQSL